MVKQKRKPRIASVQVTPLQRARQKAAAVAVANGQKLIPIVCGSCGSPSIEQSERNGCLHCLQCSRDTPERDAHKARRVEIKRFITDGIDIS